MAKDQKLTWNIVQYVLSFILAVGILNHQVFFAYPPDLSLVIFSPAASVVISILLFGWFKVMEYAEEHND